MPYFGSDVGFIKKEDKWFNYLNQNLPFSHTNTLLDGQLDLGTSFLNFGSGHFNFEKSSVQGLGVANFCSVIVEFDADGNVVSPLDQPPFFTPPTGPVVDNLTINQQLILSGEVSSQNVAGALENVDQIEASVFTGFGQATEGGGTFTTISNVANIVNITNY